MPKYVKETQNQEEENERVKLINFWGDDGCESAEELERDIPTTTTKKMIMMAAMLIIHCSVFSQIYSTVGATNNGFQFELGTTVNSEKSKFDGVLIAASFTYSADDQKGSVLAALAGYKIDILEQISITPKVGYGINFYDKEIKTGEFNKDYQRAFNYETYIKTTRGAFAANVEICIHNHWRGVYAYAGYNRVYQYGVGFIFSNFYKEAK